MDTTALYEKYRPKTLREVLGQNKAVKQVKSLLDKRWGSRAWWISGMSGTGKTTLARIIASYGASEYFVSEYDSADNISVSVLDDIEQNMCYYGGGKGGRVYIINEAHGLSRIVVRRLLGILERIPRHVVFIFTTTKQGETKLFDDNIDASPLLSRCIKIELTNQGLAKVFAEHCQEIARAENLNGKPLQSYLRLAQNCKNNCRAMLQAVECGEMIN